MKSGGSKGASHQQSKLLTRANLLLPKKNDFDDFRARPAKSFQVGRVIYPGSLTEEFERKQIIKTATLRSIYEEMSMNWDSPELTGAIAERF